MIITGVYKLLCRYKCETTTQQWRCGCGGYGLQPGIYLYTSVPTGSHIGIDLFCWLVVFFFNKGTRPRPCSKCHDMHLPPTSEGCMIPEYMELPDDEGGESGVSEQEKLAVLKTKVMEVNVCKQPVRFLNWKNNWRAYV